MVAGKPRSTRRGWWCGGPSHVNAAVRPCRAAARFPPNELHNQLLAAGTPASYVVVTDGELDGQQMALRSAFEELMWRRRAALMHPSSPSPCTSARTALSSSSCAARRRPHHHLRAARPRPTRHYSACGRFRSLSLATSFRQPTPTKRQHWRIEEEPRIEPAGSTIEVWAVERERERHEHDEHDRSPPGRC